MTQEIVLNAAQLEVMASPACSEMLASLHGTGRASATELAKKLGKSPATALYHLRRLVAVGLARVVEMKATSRRPEAIFASVSARLKLPDVDEDGLIAKAVLAGMREAMRGFAVASDKEFTHVLRSQVRLNASDAKEFIELLEAANRFATERQVPEGDVHLHWNSVVYPEKGERSLSQ